MKRSIVILAVCVAVALSVAVSRPIPRPTTQPADTAPAASRPTSRQVTIKRLTTRPATQPAKTYLLLPKLREGAKLPLRFKTATDVKYWGAYTGTRKLSDIAVTFEMLLSVGKADKKGVRNCSMLVRRVSGSASTAGDRGRFDTDKPATCRLADGRASYILRLRDGPFNAGFDADGNMVRFEPNKKVLAGLDESLKGVADKRIMINTIRDMMMRMLAQPFAYLPAEPVAVGDRWIVTRETYRYALTGLPERLSEATLCELMAVVKRKSGRVAKIKLIGRCAPPEDDDKAVIKEYALAGGVLVNLDNPPDVKIAVKITGRLKDPQTDVNAVSVNISTQTRLGGKAKKSTTRPASRPAKTPTKAKRQ